MLEDDPNVGITEIQNCIHYFVLEKNKIKIVDLLVLHNKYISCQIVSKAC